MLREGDGEKLENIARDAKLPAPRVRKRVSRLRKFLRERWAAELALIGVLLLCGGLGALYWYSRGKSPENFAEREPPRPVPSAPRVPSPQRPAGSSSTIPNLVAPPSAFPSPSPAPSGTEHQPTLSPVKPLNRARAISTEQNLAPAVKRQSKTSKLSPEGLGDFGLDDFGGFDASNAGTAPRKASKAPQTASKPSPTPAPEKK
jgi:cytoskeletal protein RodZ